MLYISLKKFCRHKKLKISALFGTNYSMKIVTFGGILELNTEDVTTLLPLIGDENTFTEGRGCNKLLFLRI